MLLYYQGLKIGKGAIIGANSTVSKSIPANSIAIGSPAKVIKKFNFKKEMWEKIGDF
ncbi:acyltransferase [Streptococcus iniae]